MTNTRQQGSREDKLKRALHGVTGKSISIDFSRPALFSRVILERRRRLSLTRHDVACLANVDDRIVSIIEDGQSRVQELPAIRAICRQLDIEIQPLGPSARPRVPLS